MKSSLIEVYLEIGKELDTSNKIIISKTPDAYGTEDASEVNILKRLQEFSFSAPNPVVKDYEGQRYAACQYTYVLQETVDVKSVDCDVTTLNHYVFCLQREDGLTTHCISSFFPYFRSFYKLLSVISSASKEGKEAAIDKLILAFVNENRIPSPGNPVTVRLPPLLGIPAVSIDHESPFTLPLMYENDHIAEFYRAFGLLQSMDASLRRDGKEASILTHIFAHLIMERRFLVTSNEVRRFTSCCYALQTIIYPLQWNYTFIPLLFPNIIDMVGLPQPYIMGIHKPHLEQALQISDSPEDCVIVLDVDTGKISPHYSDDFLILPKEVRSLLESRLANSEMISKKGDYFCRIFMDALVLMIGDYQQFFVPNLSSGTAEFSWQKYQTHRPEADYRRFGEAAESKLGMVKMFLLSRLEMFRRGQSIPFDDFERSIKDRALIAKEARGSAVQHKIKHQAGKFIGGFKKLIPPRSHSRPILEENRHPEQIKLPRHLSTEDIRSFNSVKTNFNESPAAQPKGSPHKSAIIEVTQTISTEMQQKVQPIVVKHNESNLINLGSDDEGDNNVDAEVSKLTLETADPLTLFDPLESNFSKLTAKKSSVSNVQQQELIDRVLTLYSVPTSNSRPASLASQGSGSVYLYPSQQYRLSTLFPGCLPVTMQPHHGYSAVPPVNTSFFPSYSSPIESGNSQTLPGITRPSNWTTFDD